MTVFAAGLLAEGSHLRRSPTILDDATTGRSPVVASSKKPMLALTGDGDENQTLSNTLLATGDRPEEGRYT
ncbi:MAG TPA: hypothetical protein VFB60_18385 [Ktedonobacteraceae bacterium]|nr:hypothetical protein [Ktedonobacteraceae bacterium]